MLGAFWWILMEDLRRPGRWFRRRAAIRSANVPRRVVKELAQRTGRLMLIQRRGVLVPRAQMLLHSWKKVHVPFSLIMAGIAVVHIWRELPRVL